MQLIGWELNIMTAIWKTIYQITFLEGNFSIFIQISLKYDSNGPMHEMSSVGQVKDQLTHCGLVAPY